jgi:hypothetical protein
MYVPFEFIDNNMCMYLAENNSKRNNYNIYYNKFNESVYNYIPKVFRTVELNEKFVNSYPENLKYIELDDITNDMIKNVLKKGLIYLEENLFSRNIFYTNKEELDQDNTLSYNKNIIIIFI